jgi:chromosome segregation ATPase
MAVRKTKAPVHQVESPLTADGLPVTRRMLGDVRSELLSRMDQHKHELKAEIQGVRSELRKEIQEVKTTVDAVQADIHGVKADIHGVKADVVRIGFLIEEQNARNKIVLDALSAFMDRQGRVEQRMDGVEATVRELAAARPPG